MHQNNGYNGSSRSCESRIVLVELGSDYPRAISAYFMQIRKAAAITAGIAFVPIGCLTMVSPIPGGSLVLPAALALLIYESPFFQECVRSVRKHNPNLHKIATWIEARAGKRIGGILMTTRPDSRSTDSKNSHLTD